MSNANTTPPTPAAPATKAAHSGCKHMVVTVAGGDETPLRSIRCGQCGSNLTRRTVNGEYVYAVAPRFSAYAREIAAYEADIYKAKRNARVAKKGGLR